MMISGDPFHSPISDLSARRAVDRLRRAYARLIAAGAMVGMLLAVDVLADGAADRPWLWGGLALALIANQALTMLNARLLLGWQRRAIRRRVQPDKRAVTTMHAVQVVDVPPFPEAPWWMDEPAGNRTDRAAGTV